MWKKVEKYFNDYCEHSSITGFNYVAEKRSKTERILWLLLVAVAFALAIYFIMQIWYKFDANPFIVSLATRPQPIFTIPFPAITICPTAKASRAIFNYTDVVHRIWDGKPVTPEEQETAQYMTSLCLDEANVNEQLLQNESFTNKFYERLEELSWMDVVLANLPCLFMGNEENCSVLLSPIILDAGICYTFNMLRREEIYRPNVFQYKNYLQHGLQSQWTNDEGYAKDAKKDTYPRRALESGADNALIITLGQSMNDTDYLCNDAPGFTVSIHSPNTVPETSQDYYVMPLDSVLHITLRPDQMTTSPVVKKYKPANRECYFSNERHLEYFMTYTQQNCFLECLTNYTLSACGCVGFHMPRVNTTKICGNGKIECMEYANDDLKFLEINSLLDKEDYAYKSCDCLPLCNQLAFNAETARYSWPWREYFRANKKLNLSESDSNSIHLVQLKVYFKSDQFIPSEKNELNGPFDFLSNFGGLLGLFTGFSLLSAVELVYYMSLRLWCNQRLYDDPSGPPNQ